MALFSTKNWTPLAKRRLANFRSNRRGRVSLWLFLSILLLTMPAEFVANDKPLLVRHNGRLYFHLQNWTGPKY